MIVIHDLIVDWLNQDRKRLQPFLTTLPAIDVQKVLNILCWTAYHTRLTDSIP